MDRDNSMGTNTLMGYLKQNPATAVGLVVVLLLFGAGFVAHGVACYRGTATCRDPHTTSTVLGLLAMLCFWVSGRLRPTMTLRQIYEAGRDMRSWAPRVTLLLGWVLFVSAIWVQFH
jgi:hypothetical protein